MNGIHNSYPAHTPYPTLATDGAPPRRTATADHDPFYAVGSHTSLPAPAGPPAFWGEVAAHPPAPRYCCDAATSGTFGAIGGAVAAGLPAYFATHSTPLEANLLVTGAVAPIGGTVGCYAARTPRQDTGVGATVAAVLAMLALDAAAGLKVGLVALAYIEDPGPDVIATLTRASTVSALIFAGISCAFASTVLCFRPRRPQVPHGGAIQMQPV